MLTDSETSTLFKLTASKKREALAVLNHFNSLTGEYVNKYQKVCDDLFFNIKKRLHFSTHRYLIVLNFFKDFKLAANADYKFNVKLKELDEKEKKADVENKTNETLIDNGIALFYNDLKFFVDGANKLQQSTEKDIMEKLLKDTFKKLESQLKDLVERVKKNYATLERKGQSVARRLAEFNRSFNVSIADNDTGRRCVVDTSDCFITYINRVKTLTTTLAQYGKHILEYRELALELNHRQNQCLKEALIEFTRLVGEFVGDINNTRFSKSVGFLKSMNLEPSKGEYFDIAKLVTNSEDLAVILDGLTPSTPNIVEAISNLKIQPIEPLYDLFSRKYYSFSDSYKHPIDSLLFITLDFFFVVYKRDKKELFEKLLSIPIEFVTLEFDEINQIVKCVYKSKGIFWDTNKTLKISMKREHMDELLLSYDFATNVVKDIITLSPASSMRQMTDELAKSEGDDKLNGQNQAPNNISESYISEDEKDEHSPPENSGSDNRIIKKEDLESYDKYDRYDADKKEDDNHQFKDYNYHNEEDHSQHVQKEDDTTDHHKDVHDNDADEEGQDSPKSEHNRPDEKKD